MVMGMPIYYDYAEASPMLMVILLFYVDRGTDTFKYIWVIL